MRPPPTSSFRRLGVSSSYLDSTPDDAILVDGDTAMDSDPEAWDSDNDDPAPLPSRGGGPTTRGKGHSRPSPSGLSQGRHNPWRARLDDDNIGELLEDAIYAIDFLNEELHYPEAIECLADHEVDLLQSGIVQMLHLLSCNGALDHAFDSDSWGDSRHDFLCRLRKILGRYYPSVDCTDDEWIGRGPPVLPSPAS